MNVKVKSGITFAGHWPITSGNWSHLHMLYSSVDRHRKKWT